VRFGQRYHKPIWVLENGTADRGSDSDPDDDVRRQRFLVRHVRAMARARDEGADVRGYFCWSLLDNFEWSLGFVPRFGLHEVDRTTFERTPKPSAAWYAAIVEANALGDTEVDLEVSANMNSGDPTETPVPPLTPESPPFASKQ
jgi:beta-glucosidase